MDDFSIMRYAHSDGHTDLCFDETGANLVTCGTDGDIRTWKGFDDDNPQTHNIANIVTAVALRNKLLYVATDTFSVSAYTFPQIEFESIVAQYNSTVHHIVCSADGNLVASGGGDFVIKVYAVSSKILTAFHGHDGTILSLAFDAKGKYLASSGCDGTVRVWQISDQECIQTLNILKKNNDISPSSPLSRLSWSPEGEFLAVPVEKEILLYQRDKWDNTFALKDESIDQFISIASFSPFGNYIAASTTSGQLIVWDVEKKSCVSRKSNENKLTISSFAWNPSGKHIVFCDIEGQIGIYERPLAFSQSQVIMSQASKVDRQDVPIDFECEDDSKDKDDDEANDLDLFYDNEENDNAFDIGAIKASLEPKIFGTSDDPDNESVKSEKPEPKVQLFEAPKPIVQTSFQPSSTPIHLERRFMLWNAVGIVRCYNTEEENSIDVEFHDANVYHPLHLNNTRNHTLAALSTEALLLACPKVDKDCSKLECMHFGTWDSNKEWMVDMPEDEDIESIALGEGFAVCITSMRLIHIFTISGVQCEVLAVPGPVVCSSAREKQVSIAYHKGLGIENDQCLNLMVIDVKLGGHCVVRDFPLPLSPKSFLGWLGYTDEGQSCIVDTRGIVNLLTTNFGMKWTPIANTKTNLRGMSDTYFVIGLSEIKQEIRCILCKGAKYPSLLPKPTVAVISFSLPFCEMASDKGKLEEENRRCVMTHKRLENLVKEGYDIDSEYNAVEKKWMDMLLKMFALATRIDREYRALEIAEMMPNTNIIQGAIKYATQRHRIALAERLGEVMNKKILGEEEEADPFAEYESINMSQESNISRSLRLKNVEDDVILKPKPLSRSRLESPRSASSEQALSDPTSSLDNLEHISLLPKSAVVTTNPFRASFKVKSLKNDENTTDIDTLLDSSMKNLNNKHNSSSTPIAKATKKKSQEPKNDTQTKLGGFHSELQPKKFGFQLFLEENKDIIQCSSESEMNESEVIRAAMKMYKELSTEEKQKYAQQSKKECLTNITNGTLTTDKPNPSDCLDVENSSEDTPAATNENTSKRKDNSETEDVPKPKKLKTISKPADTTMRKLTQFSFTKKPKQTE